MIRKITYFSLSCALLVCVMIAFERPAYAYVDPGSGLFFLQSVSTAAIGVVYVLRRKLKLVKTAKEPQAVAPHDLTSSDAGSAQVS